MLSKESAMPMAPQKLAKTKHKTVFVGLYVMPRNVRCLRCNKNAQRERKIANHCKTVSAKQKYKTIGTAINGVNATANGIQPRINSVAKLGLPYPPTYSGNKVIKAIATVTATAPAKCKLGFVRPHWNRANRMIHFCRCNAPTAGSSLQARLNAR
jgi:hypothetical protein